MKRRDTEHEHRHKRIYEARVHAHPYTASLHTNEMCTREFRSLPER